VTTGAAQRRDQADGTRPVSPQALPVFRKNIL